MRTKECFIKKVEKMKRFWMAFAAFALIAAALPSCSSNDDPTPPHQEVPVNPEPGPENEAFTVTASNITATDFALSVKPNSYTGNYYVGIVPAAVTAELTGREIAEALVEQDLSDGIDLGAVDNEYIYKGAATIPSLRSLWMFSAGSEVAVVVFGLSASGEILTDVVVETVQLLPLAESDFVLSLGQVTSTTAEVSVTGTPGSSFYIGLFTTEAISSIDKNDLADVIISTFGEDILKSVFTLPEDQDTGRISFSGLSASTSFTFVLFGFDKEKLEVVSATQTQTFTTPAGGDTPVNPGDYAFGTITLSNPTNSSVDMEIVPADATKPYTIMVELADYVDQFASDAQLFSEDLAFYYDYMSSQNITGMTVYQLFDQNDLLYTGSVKGSYGDLEPGTRYCAYAYYMNAEETLDGDIAKAYFTTTGTAAASVKAVRSVRRNYVERPFQVPAVLGAAASCDAVLAPAFGKVR